MGLAKLPTRAKFIEKRLKVVVKPLTVVRTTLVQPGEVP
jgi:hypothetical protein